MQHLNLDLDLDFDLFRKKFATLIKFDSVSQNFFVYIIVFTVTLQSPAFLQLFSKFSPTNEYSAA